MQGDKSMQKQLQYPIKVKDTDLSLSAKHF